MSGDIEVGQALRGDDVVAVMARLKQLQQRVPERFQTDNGSEFISKALEDAQEKGRVLVTGI